MAAYFDIYDEKLVDHKQHFAKMPRIDIFDTAAREFYQRHRFTKNAFINICDMLRNDLRTSQTRRSDPLSVEYKVAIALRYYATGHFQFSISDMYNVNQSTVFKCINQVSDALVSHLDEIIKWPSVSHLTSIKHGYFQLAGFPNVIGCVDCTHVRVLQPAGNNAFQYLNRKSYYSINVQAICDTTLRFTNAVIKWPGGTHDSYILRQSSVWEYMEQNAGMGYILGDSAYPLRPWLLTPLSSPCSESERKYNRCFTSTRVRIENAFGMLKRRFHLLHVENRRKPANVVKDIAACMVLHNLAIEYNMPDFPEEMLDIQPIETPCSAGLNTGNLRRRYVIDTVFS